MRLKLRKFDISCIEDDKVVVLIGKRDTGKSFLVRDLLYYHQNIPIGTVISGTESANKFYGNMVPSLFIHDEYNTSIIQNLLQRQNNIMIKHKADNSIDPRAFLILDDCLYDNKWTNDPNVRFLFMNGRHYKVMFVITMQYPLGIPPNLRTNIDYVFILRENLVANRKRIYENYAGMFPNFDVFCQVMDQCTENYECLVIHNNAKSNRLEDQVFWYKAEPHGDFKIGAKLFWDLHERHYQDNNEGEDSFDMKNVKQKNRPLINVHKMADY